MTLLLPKKLAMQAIVEGLSLPPVSWYKEEDVIPTMNQKGYMYTSMDSITEEFIARVISIDGRHLEVGAAYGNVTIEALRRGCKHYIANDLDLRHLKILARRIQEEHPDLIENLQIILGDYPSGIQLEAGTIDSILIARVLHFFSPDKILEVAKNAHKLLKPGGKIYILCVSPYTQVFKNFIPTFELSKRNGQKYYGYTTEKEKYLSTEILRGKAINGLESGEFTFFDVDSFSEYFDKSNFIIEKAIYLPYEEKSIFRLDGRERTGAVIIKR